MCCKKKLFPSSSTLWENYWVRYSTYMGCCRHPLLPSVQMLITYALRMDTVLHQSCKIWLLSEICREFLNDGPLSCIEVNRFYKNDKPCLLISLLLQRTLSLQEFQYTLHDPENTELVLLVLVHLTCSHQAGKRGFQYLDTHAHVSSFNILFCSYMGYEIKGQC